MTKLSRHLLARAPEETSRRLCLGFLDDASGALERMEDPNDKEALHDFRVSLRRLRSLMRAFRPFLQGSATRKLRDRVKTLAGSTNVARDAEVQIEWLTGSLKTLGDPGASGASHLISILAERQATTPSLETLRHGFRPLRRDLTKALSRLRLHDDTAAANFVQATATLIRKHADVLRANLTAAHSAEDADLLHRARIETKRLRYMIEPLQQELKDAQSVIKQMKSLQDILGELQDTRVMTEEISAALESSALDEARKLRDLALAEAELPEAYPPQNPGLLALLKAQRTRRDRAFTKLTVAWTGSAAETYFGLVDRFVERALRWPEREIPKRRFLLSQVPAELRKQKSVVVREGWLPGKDIRERVRAIRDGRNVRYLRVIDSLADRQEEDLTRRTFDALWALTEARRLEFRRYELMDGPRSWCVVSVVDTDVVLALVEESVDAPIPEPIQTVMLREVTGVKKYELEALARAKTTRS